MTLSDFLASVHEIAKEKPAYKLGRSGDDGYCDCIGLIIGAVERCGEKWSGIHGTNWWARHYTDSLMRATSADDLSVGDIVYKARVPGEAGYDLPDRYNSDPDKRDYYHVGVVMGVNPLEIMHCTSGGGVDGITTDSKIGKWTYKGQLTMIASADSAEALQGNAVVRASSGKTVNLRDKASRSGDIIKRVPIGTAVEVLDVDGDWARIRVPVEGYMMREYLEGGAG